MSDDILVLYKKNKDLIVFDFNIKGVHGEVTDLLNFHFFENNDFDHLVETSSKSIFRNFYEESTIDEDVEFVGWEHVNRIVY